MYRIAIDRGGTFTDVWSQSPSGKIRVLKLLSEDPQNYDDAPREAIKRILEEDTGTKFNDGLIDTNDIEWIRMGTTVATNALLERKGERCALLVTKGFRDLLYIGNQARPNLFDLSCRSADVLYDCIVEVDERVVLHQDRCQLHMNFQRHSASTGEEVYVQKSVDEVALKEDLKLIYNSGIRSLAVVLMHSYMYKAHEIKIKEIALEMGFKQVSLSSEVMDMVRIVPRGYTACVDAYLTPCIRRYVDGFSKGFKRGLLDQKVLFMQSDGGLTPVEKFYGSRAIVSGPAGGVVGYALTTFGHLTDLPVVGFDMGGTSTDVSRFAGTYEHIFESQIAGVTIQAPQLDINTVAAGGGSRLFFRSGMFVVGPESAGAHPGPVCYRKGGYLTVTDANLLLGRILPDFFPKIFGPQENEPLDFTATAAAFDKLTEHINEFLKSQGKNEELTREEVAIGFLRVANETMCRPIRALTQGKGYDTARHALAVFGGAGGQHACAVAQSLGISTIFIHKYAGILSAFGLALADVVHEAQEPSSLVYKPDEFERIENRIDSLIEECRTELIRQGFSKDNIVCEPFLHLRYEGTDCALMCSPVNEISAKTTSPKHGNFEAAFLKRYQTEFGFTLPGRNIRVDDIRVRGIAKSGVQMSSRLARADSEPKRTLTTSCYFEEGARETPVYLLSNLGYGHELAGPAIIIDNNSTILVEPNSVARILETGDIQIDVQRHHTTLVGTELDAIQLSIFSHRFMSTAEQMGRVLQRTAISTNIKERLDFSCALFGPDGGLVANAPHIPVHLGAMQSTVQYQMKHLETGLRPGDVILTNHPQCGGSHLPDLTVITPIFHKSSDKPIFFVANRGHHADIGGATPGSMPPHSKSINEEGAVFKSFRLVVDGVFQEEAVTQALMEPERHEGCSGTRNLTDNLSDLRAQIAANQKGISLIMELIEEYSLPVVQAYMKYIQENAEVAVRELLRGVATSTLTRTGKTELLAEDRMDDGSVIRLLVRLDQDSGSAVFDFTGTTPQVLGNINTPRAVSQSCLIYCLRCMVGYDVPLNQGCLKPVTTIIPDGTLLSPGPEAAVVGGNVLTSQRIVDVIFKAFSTCAASQGCMNNITFGDDSVGYYETVAGGAGAGPTWSGRSGVHSHMTNTRITDPEILERRLPVILRKFHLRKNSGGNGLFRGGDGVVRELLFRRPLTLSALTERRVHQPYGLNGGQPGCSGINLLKRHDGRSINIGGKVKVEVGPGDKFILKTPGGGGYGLPEDKKGVDILPKNGDFTTYIKGSVFDYLKAQESA